MEICKIYLSGAMTDVSREESTKWRTRFKQALLYSDYSFEKKPKIFDPTMYYNTYDNFHKTEKEAMEFDLYELRKSDVVVVNLDYVKSVGTAMELILAKEYHIPVIAINKDGKELHPWIKECITRECDSMREAVGHIVEYYLW